MLMHAMLCIRKHMPDEAQAPPDVASPLPAPRDLEHPAVADEGVEKFEKSWQELIDATQGQLDTAGK